MAFEIPVPTADHWLKTRHKSTLGSFIRIALRVRKKSVFILFAKFPSSPVLLCSYYTIDQYYCCQGVTTSIYLSPLQLRCPHPGYPRSDLANLPNHLRGRTTILRRSDGEPGAKVLISCPHHSNLQICDWGNVIERLKGWEAERSIPVDDRRLIFFHWKRFLGSILWITPIAKIWECQSQSSTTVVGNLDRVHTYDLAVAQGSTRSAQLLVGQPAGVAQAAESMASHWKKLFSHIKISLLPYWLSYL